MSVAWSPIGHKIASGSYGYGNTIKIWDTESHEYECLKTLSGHTGGVLSVVWSPDGHKIASSSGDHSIKIWDIESHEYVCLNTLNGHLSWV